jgi:hypothetical protein
MLYPIDAHITEPVRAALDAIGRTEDVRFSPDNRLLAIAGFKVRRCLILRVAIEAGASGPRITVDDFMTVSSDRFRAVHGVDFIDDRTIAVASRMGPVSILELPRGELGGRHVHVEALHQVTRASPLLPIKSPGSLALRRRPDGTVSLLVCNNYSSRVTQHFIDTANGHRVARNEVLLARGLHIPDGIALSHDDAWIAVSNHKSENIVLYETAGGPGRWTAPAGLLRGVTYPHGLRFTADGGHLLAAEAGAPLVRVYARGESWRGAREPQRSVAIMDDETFRRGNHNPLEGGPKGLDIDRTGSVVVLTCDEMPLAFFPLDGFIGPDASLCV